MGLSLLFCLVVFLLVAVFILCWLLLVWFVLCKCLLCLYWSVSFYSVDWFRLVSCSVYLLLARFVSVCFIGLVIFGVMPVVLFVSLVCFVLC